MTRKFKIGKRYGEDAVIFEITGRTDKMVRFVEIFHPGKFNEKKRNPGSAKISSWDGCEVFFKGCHEVHA